MRTKGAARDKLLDEVMRHLLANGLGDPSLRQLGGAVGTSHRMLIYHFGSKEELLVEVVRALENQNQMVLKEMIDPDVSPATNLRQIWEYATREEFAPYLRLFFELYGQALQRRPHTAEFLEGIVDTMHGPLTQLFRRDGTTLAQARDEARLALATIRGLLLDLLATGDHRKVNRAFARYVTRYEASSAAARPGLSI
jgi:AcrR family transcriptional regulator